VSSALATNILLSIIAFTLIGIYAKLDTLYAALYIGRALKKKVSIERAPNVTDLDR
jgi:hypothetical protein